MTDLDVAARHRRDRGAPLVATWGRWGVATALLAAGAAALGRTYAAVSHSGPSSPAMLGSIGMGACAAAAALVWITLRAEEVRLSRELRMARTGTSLLRAMVVRRRQQASLWARLTGTKLGLAAVLLAEGDREGALDAMSRESPLLRGGRLEKLRRVVEADADRAGGASGGLDICVKRLWAMPRIGNREADLTRMHVLVKALLQLGDVRAGVDLARELGSSRDEEERAYLAWLRVWFDLGAAAGTEDAWDPLSEGDIRMALLLARSHGAEKLVEKLDARLGAIACSKEGG
jgi:hypothetical protein